MLNCGTQEIGEFDFKFSEIVKDVVCEHRFESRVPHEHVAFRHGVTRVNLAHVDASVFPDHAFGKEVEWVEPLRVHLERKQTNNLHEFDRAKFERVREPCEFAHARATLAAENRGHVGLVEFASVGESRRIEASILRE